MIVPEPTTGALTGMAALAGLAFALKKRKN
jgi:hypothetical protein